MIESQTQKKKKNDTLRQNLNMSLITFRLWLMNMTRFATD